MSTQKNTTFEKLLASGLDQLLDYHEALNIVRGNSTGGRIWLIGSQVYNNIVCQLYGVSQSSNHDFDFLVEFPQPAGQEYVPEGWKQTLTGAGGLRLLQSGKQIDIAALDQAINPAESSSLKNMNTGQKIDSYFRRTPLTIQALIYEIDSGILTGDVGREAIQTKTVAINNLQECEIYCQRHAMKPAEYIQNKAASLGFQVVI